ncbi:MAG TPA: DUF2804 family protein [Solirubrobacteraceae bacterium]|jgi:hypothetical protein|nr:DUF2804 family protein [Solirubrobacteraceae bacterium]
MRLFRGTRPLKRWRYVGVFGEQFMICAASVQVGPARQTFWAVFEHASGAMTERTRMIPRRGALDLTPGRLRIRDDAVLLDLTLDEDDGIEARCPNASAYVWTRKQAGVRAHGRLALEARPPIAIDALAVIDDTAGYHARVTEWWWAAGVGNGPDGTPLAFNLVQGVNDPSSGSERAVWVAGIPHEAPPVRFAEDLRTIASDDGSQLRFGPQAERSRRDNLLLVRSDYRAPFGTFGGMLPGGIELSQALGVVEHHRARW